jgi:hypothetical protein
VYSAGLRSMARIIAGSHPPVPADGHPDGHADRHVRRHDEDVELAAALQVRP